MRVYLMRHGIAIDRQDPKCPAEAERYLTSKGIERTRAAAFGLRELKIQPKALLTSPYVRAVQTAEIICDVLDIDSQMLKATDALKPEARPSRLIEELGRLSADEVMCFGHAPHADEFIAHITRAAAAFTSLRKAGVACLDLEPPSAGRATLLWLFTSKAIRRLGE